MNSLQDKIIKLQAQIEKMKCCGNCRHEECKHVATKHSRMTCGNCVDNSKWEIFDDSAL